jgi:DNA-binding SARP family transcriptional activator
MFQLRVLGRATVTKSGTEVRLPVGKPFALLCYLVLEGREVSRDELGETLWRGAPPARARQSVRQALSLLRRGLRDCVRLENGSVAVDASEWTTDADEVDQLVDDGQFAEARALWKGPPLGAFKIAGSPLWTRWAEEYQDICTQRIISKLLRQASALMDGGDTRPASEALELAAHIDSDRLDVRMAAARLLIATQEYDRAEVALNSLRAEGAGEIYGEEISRLREVLDKIEVPEEVPASDALQLELVGRSLELARLVSDWRQVSTTEKSRSILIRGPAGVGKTRLVNELVGVVRGGGGRVCEVAGQRGANPLRWDGLSQLVHALLRADGSHGISSASDRVLHSLLPSLGGSQPGATAALEPAVLADAVAELIGSVSFEGETLLVFEDLQWLDQESRSLFAHVARRMDDSATLFVFTYRSANGSGIEGLDREIKLEPLGLAEVGELLGLTVELEEPASHDDIVHRLWSASAGNPLYLHELFQLLIQHGSLVVGEDGTRILAGRAVEEGAFEPSTLSSLIGQRLSGIDTSSRRLLSVLAEFPGPAGIPEITERAGLPAEEIDRGLTELASMDFVRIVDTNLFMFSHEELRTVVRSQSAMLPQRRSRPVTWAAAVLVLISLGLLGAIGLRSSEGPEEWPLGEGMIIISSDAGMLEIRPPPIRGGDWSVTESDLWRPDAPETTSLNFVQRDREGRVVWFGTHRSEGSPFAVSFTEPGILDTIFRSEGQDVEIQTVSPDLMRALLTADNPDTEKYDTELFLLEIDDVGARKLYPSFGRLSYPKWSESGREIAFSLPGRPDTVVVIDGFGTEVSRVVMSDVKDVYEVDWCAGGGELVARVRVGDAGRSGFLSLSTGRLRLLPDRGRLLGLECLPGRHLGAFEVSDGIRSFAVYDSVGVLLFRSPPVPGQLNSTQWLPDTPPVFVDSISVQPSLRLGLGERRALEFAVRLSDGTLAPEEIQFFSDDRSIVSVDARGMLTANRAGPTRVHLRSPNGLQKSVNVEVIGAVAEGVLFQDSFDDLDEWVAYGDPPPILTLEDGDSVLFVHGDGNYMEFVASRESFEISQGATLEWDVQMPLSRTDRQRYYVCMFADPLEYLPVPAGIALHSEVVRGESACWRYPSDENSRFDPLEAAATIGPFSVGEWVRLPEDYSSADWNRLSLQVLPDGSMEVYSNQALIHSTETTLSSMEGRWRIFVGGVSVDTRLLVREVTLWSGARYGGGG